MIFYKIIYTDRHALASDIAGAELLEYLKLVAMPTPPFDGSIWVRFRGLPAPFEPTQAFNHFEDLLHRFTRGNTAIA